MRIAPLFASVMSLCLAASQLQAVEIIAHRGASYDAPENTVASFKLGWEQKADADELDIYLSKDGQIVVMHDGTTKRTAGVDKKIVEQDLAELRALDAGKWKGDQWAGEKIPTLAEALETMPAGKRFFIEIKCKSEILPELKRVLEASKKSTEQLVIIGFDYATMLQAKQAFPKIPVYWLASPTADKKTGKVPTVDELIEKAKAAKVDGLNLNFNFPIDAAFTAKVKSAGLGLYVWTVDDADVAAKLVAAGVDGITTNRPAWLREQLKQ
ncbi:glycerophosphodiester phosphodiesterase [Verrucomicrobiota bacterium sgz303538]